MSGNVIHSSADVSSPLASVRGQVEHLDRGRDSVDLVAERLWKIASGETCPLRWEMLPEDQKAWWHKCAKHQTADMMLPPRRRPPGTGLRLIPSGWPQH